MSIKIGINGFGRIGKGILRIIEEMNNDEIEVVAIKDLSSIDDHSKYIENIAYLLKHDSIYGEFPKEVGVDGNNLVIGARKIPIFLGSSITDVKWDELGVEVLIDSSGVDSNAKNMSKCIKGITSKGIITRGSSSSDFTIIFGVNEANYNKSNHHIISSSTCTGNAFSPIAKFIDDRYRIKNGFVSTIHPVLSNEKMMDGFNKTFQLGRATKTIKLTSTAVVNSTIEVIPHLKDKLSTEAVSFRLPTDIVSVVQAVLVVDKKIKKDNFIEQLKLEINTSLKGIYGLSEGFLGHSLVGADFIKNSYSGIFDTNYFHIHGDMCLISIWHDNEYGYCRRVYDTIKYIYN